MLTTGYGYNSCSMQIFRNMIFGEDECIKVKSIFTSKLHYYWEITCCISTSLQNLQVTWENNLRRRQRKLKLYQKTSFLFGDEPLNSMSAAIFPESDILGGQLHRMITVSSLTSDLETLFLFRPVEFSLHHWQKLKFGVGIPIYSFSFIKLQLHRNMTL